MKRKPLRCLAALVCAAVFALTLPGCAAGTIINAITDGKLPDVTATPAAASGAPAEPEQTPGLSAEPLAQEAASGKLVPFPDMVYVRPDIDAITAKLTEIADSVRVQSSAEAVTGLLSEAKEIYNDFMTDTTLAMIHDSIDRSDAYWQAEYAFCSESASRVKQAFTAVSAAVSDSPAGRAAGMEPTQSLFDASGIVDLLSEQTRLVHQYQTALATLTASDGTEAFTLPSSNDGHRYEIWLNQNAQTLGTIYADLLRVRQQIAQAVGYSNYMEYAFDTRGSGFTIDMVRTLMDQVAEKLAPLDAAVRGSITTPTLELSEPVMLQSMGAWMPRLSESLDESLTLMEDYQLYDFSDGPNKDPGAFTTYLPSYGAPFLMASYTGAYNALKDVVHEFGHFNNYALDPNAASLSPDIGEVFSTALVLLCSNFWAESFGEEEGGRMVNRLLYDSLSTFPYQAYLLSFEMEAYALPAEEISYENLCRISEEQWYRFGEAQSPFAATDWTATTHLVETPFYVLSYMLATDISMQIWEQSIDDLPGAMQIYYELMNNAAQGASFMENIGAVGLVNPFTDYEMAVQAAYFTACLSAGMTPQEARASHMASLRMGEEEPVEEPQPEEPAPQETQAPEPVQEPTQEPTPAGSRPRIETKFGFSDGRITTPIG